MQNLHPFFGMPPLQNLSFVATGASPMKYPIIGVPRQILIIVHASIDLPEPPFGTIFELDRIQSDLSRIYTHNNWRLIFKADDHNKRRRYTFDTQSADNSVWNNLSFCCNSDGRFDQCNRPQLLRLLNFCVLIRSDEKVELNISNDAFDSPLLQNVVVATTDRPDAAKRLNFALDAGKYFVDNAPRYKCIRQQTDTADNKTGSNHQTGKADNNKGNNNHQTSKADKTRRLAGISPATIQAVSDCIKKAAVKRSNKLWDSIPSPMKKAKPLEEEPAPVAPAAPAAPPATSAAPSTSTKPAAKKTTEAELTTPQPQVCKTISSMAPAAKKEMCETKEEHDDEYDNDMHDGYEDNKHEDGKHTDGKHTDGKHGHDKDSKRKDGKHTHGKHNNRKDGKHKDGEHEDGKNEDETRLGL